MVGRIGFFDIKIKNHSCEIGYWLEKNMTGKGIMTLCVKALERLLFEEFGINRIVIRCNKENQNSSNVAKRCGFCFEGELREERFSKSGQPANLLIFSKLKSEY